MTNQKVCDACGIRISHKDIYYEVRKMNPLSYQYSEMIWHPEILGEYCFVCGPETDEEGKPRNQGSKL
jgi:hypothetical protein